ncbi:hypothetical protein [Leucothrix arctica]|uniref:DUF4124 domain-containing protein n=1 Tax=Leucothrix arctica TaxID=1481894 RepID=A0A317CME9_9GAMM|nr:hypothetical protein [Leucothrix arctica]PWQ97492.1 hypothetical protein DKT75_06085 [Leucothrix arctica]
MKYQINKVVLFSAITIAATSNVYAGCEWTNGSLGQTVETTSVRLKQYSECKTDCKQLETGLNSTISLMNTASECGAGVLTAKNQQMVEFFNRRFKLIRKLKTGQSYTIATTTSKPVQAVTRETKMNISSGSYQALWSDDNQQNAAPAAAPSPVQTDNTGDTIMAIPPDAYQALWVDDNNANQRQAQQRQLQLQKQAQIRQQNLRNAEARKRQIILAQQQERVRQKQLQHQRARAIYLAQQKARQQQLARARN